MNKVKCTCNHDDYALHRPGCALLRPIKKQKSMSLGKALAKKRDVSRKAPLPYCERQEHLVTQIPVASTVYIAGPMTGIQDFNRPAFHKMEQFLKDHVGCSVLSPARWPDGHPYSWYIEQDIKLLLASEYVVFLKGWINSQGAKLEHRIAVMTNKQIRHER